MPPENTEPKDAADTPWQPSQRYPDSAVQIIDQSFARYRLNLAAVERIAHGFRWSEGPVWFGDGRYLLWSDIPNNRIMKWEEETGAVSIFRRPSNFANGNTRDRQGRLVTCEHGGRRVTRTEYDGTISVIAGAFGGKALNSPNDVIVKSDGSIWFTDPPFGLLGYYEGHLAKQELPMNVYRVDGQSGEMTVVEGGVGPNDRVDLLEWAARVCLNHIDIRRRALGSGAQHERGSSIAENHAGGSHASDLVGKFFRAHEHDGAIHLLQETHAFCEPVHHPSARGDEIKGRMCLEHAKLA